MEHKTHILFLACIGIGIVYCLENQTQLATAPDDSDQCPPWFFYNSETTQCECYSSPNTDEIVRCTEEGALLRFGYCMTYEVGRGMFVSPCNYFEVDDHRMTKYHYIRLPDNISELNDYMCQPLNRKGLACSKCIENFGPSIMSTRYKCSNCCLLYTSPSPRDATLSRMPSSA